MRLHREGTTIMLTTALVLLGLNLSAYYFLFRENATAMWLLGLASLVVLVLIVQFFRLPTRILTLNENQIIAPADGTVVVIEETVESEYFKDKRQQVSIFMSPINVHINLNPLSGIVSYFRYYPGKFLVAWHPKSSTDNERTTVVIKQPNGVEVLMRQIAGALARRIIWYVNEGDSVKQAQEMGFIKFGSRVDLYLPLDAKINVTMGQKTKGGVTVVAELV